MAFNFLRWLKSSENIHKKIHVFLKAIVFQLNTSRSYSSVLYISGKRASKTFSYLTPYLDGDERFRDVDKLQNNYTLRGLNINAGKIKEMWDFYMATNRYKLELEEKCEDILNQIRDVQEKDHLSSNKKQDITKLRLQLQVVKQDLKGVQNSLWELDDSVEKFLKLPNSIDPRTPHVSSVILKHFGELHELPEATAMSHIDIGKHLGLLEYENPMQCYFCNDAALFELGVLKLAGKLLHSDNMVRVMGSDFSRGVVVEGAGLNHEDPSDAFVIENHSDIEKGMENRMHLVGTSSLISMLALHTKQLINPKYFPLKYFSTGREYVPFQKAAEPQGLFTLCQVSNAHTFIIVNDMNSNEYVTEFEKLLETVCNLYNKICHHYQVVLRPARELQPWETMRASFELWSPFAKRYVEVGHISAYGDYICKRLLITYQTPTGRAFPAIISGTVLSVPRLLGCLLEQNPTKFVIPPEVLKHIPADCVTL